jgi:hypothetical protein
VHLGVITVGYPDRGLSHLSSQGWAGGESALAHAEEGWEGLCAPVDEACGEVAWERSLGALERASWGKSEGRARGGVANTSTSTSTPTLAMSVSPPLSPLGLGCAMAASSSGHHDPHSHTYPPLRARTHTPISSASRFPSAHAYTKGQGQGGPSSASALRQRGGAYGYSPSTLFDRPCSPAPTRRLGAIRRLSPAAGANMTMLHQHQHQHQHQHHADLLAESGDMATSLPGPDGRTRLVRTPLGARVYVDVSLSVHLCFGRPASNSTRIVCLSVCPQGCVARRRRLSDCLPLRHQRQPQAQLEPNRPTPPKAAGGAAAANVRPPAGYQYVWSAAGV